MIKILIFISVVYVNSSLAIDCMKCGNGTIHPGQVCADDWVSNCRRCYVKGKLDCGEPRCRKSKVLAVENGCLKTRELNQLANKENDCYDEKVGDKIVRMCLCPNDFCNDQFEKINEQFEHGRPQKATLAPTQAATAAPAPAAPVPVAAPIAPPPQPPQMIPVAMAPSQPAPGLEFPPSYGEDAGHTQLHCTVPVAAFIASPSEPAQMTPVALAPSQPAPGLELSPSYGGDAEVGAMTGAANGLKIPTGIVLLFVSLVSKLLVR